MAVTLELKPFLDSRLREPAMASGISLQAFLIKLIEGALSNRRSEAAVELLAKWDEEDATRDPEELDERRSEWESPKKAMNEGHSSEDKE